MHEKAVRCDETWGQEGKLIWGRVSTQDKLYDRLKETMTDFTTSLKHFASFNRAPGPTLTDATKRKTPHKPLQLLAVLDLVHRGVIASRR